VVSVIAMPPDSSTPRAGRVLPLASPAEPAAVAPLAALASVPALASLQPVRNQTVTLSVTRYARSPLAPALPWHRLDVRVPRESRHTLPLPGLYGV